MLIPCFTEGGGVCATTLLQCDNKYDGMLKYALEPFPLPAPGLSGGRVVTVISRSFETDLSVLRSHWQHNNNFERQSNFKSS